MAGDNITAAKIPTAGNVISVALSMVTFGVLFICLTRKIQAIGRWKRLPLASWLTLIIYFDSTLFVFCTAVIARGFGINDSQGICEAGIYLCLTCYMSTKILIYYLWVEKAYIIRGSRNARKKDKLYLFNCFCMLLPYIIVVILNFVFRIAYINKDGVCIIGMQKVAMLPLIAFDVVVNVYLTLLFLVPLRSLYSYQHNTNASLRTMAIRTFIGSLATLISSVVNLTVLMVLKGEPGWICLMCCNADVLFSIVVLHWVTSIDSMRGSTPGSGPSHPHSQPGKSTTGGAPTLVRDSALFGASRVEAGKLPPKGIITTECHAGDKGLGGKRGPSDFEVQSFEMDKIRVHTERTVEVEIDGRSEKSFGSMSESPESMRVYPGRENSTDKIV